MEFLSVEITDDHVVGDVTVDDLANLEARFPQLIELLRNSWDTESRIGTLYIEQAECEGGDPHWTELRLRLRLRLKDEEVDLIKE